MSSSLGFTSTSNWYTRVQSSYATIVASPVLLKHSARGSDISMVVLDTSLYSSSSQYLTHLLEVPTAIARSHGLNSRQTGCAAAEIFKECNILCILRSQNLTVPSLLPLTAILESGEMSRHVISYPCALKVLMLCLMRISHNFTLVSKPPDTTMLRPGARSTFIHEQLVKCPVNLETAIQRRRGLWLWIVGDDAVMDRAL